jgi:hypothetical protein
MSTAWVGNDLAALFAKVTTPATLNTMIGLDACSSKPSTALAFGAELMAFPHFVHLYHFNHLFATSTEIT